MILEQLVIPGEFVELDQKLEHIAALHLPISLGGEGVGQLSVGLLGKAPVQLVIGIPGAGGNHGLKLKSVNQQQHDVGTEGQCAVLNDDLRGFSGIQHERQLIFRDAGEGGSGRCAVPAGAVDRGSLVEQNQVCGLGAGHADAGFTGISQGSGPADVRGSGTGSGTVFGGAVKTLQIIGLCITHSIASLRMISHYFQVKLLVSPL